MDYLMSGLILRGFRRTQVKKQGVKIENMIRELDEAKRIGNEVLSGCDYRCLLGYILDKMQVILQ